MFPPTFVKQSVIPRDIQLMRMKRCYQQLGFKTDRSLIKEKDKEEKRGEGGEKEGGRGGESRGRRISVKNN